MDAKTNGFQPSELIILAARPSMGKTALVCNFAEAIAERTGKAVLLFSLEQSKLELAERFLCIRAKVNGHVMRSGQFDEAERHRLLVASSELNEMPLFIDDKPGRTVSQISAIARRLKRQKDLGVVIVDYLQLVEPEDKKVPREQQIAFISRRLKFIAKELRIPVIALAQLNRGVELREDKRPRLADLRECVTGDTLVQLADGRRVPVADLVGQRPRVHAVTDFGRHVVARAEAVWPVGRRPVFRIALASGRTVRATAEHRFYGPSDWMQVRDLAPGDRLALARRTPEPDRPERWPEEHLILLGHLVGDGSYLSGQPLRYCTASPENSDAVRRAAEHGFGARTSISPGRGSWHTVLISGNGNRWQPAGVNLWLRELGIFDQRSHEETAAGIAVPTPGRAVGDLPAAPVGHRRLHPRAGGRAAWLEPHLSFDQQSRAGGRRGRRAVTAGDRRPHQIRRTGAT